ncbi:MAG TPA: efflux RND transporter permease subunit, partial [Acidobacteriaceae bacterium]|nr:efflux RND transporter permease subunit [Acidobacteriaceae bacterium]
MWIVRLALKRPYTFIVLAILIFIAAPVVILRTPTDIFPTIDIPVVSVAWQYTGLSPEELEGRVTTPYEKALTTLVDNIQHIESTTLNGQVIVKVYLQPSASLDTANAQVSAASEFMLKQLPPGILPPEIIDFSASTVPILQLGLSGKGLSEQQLNDYGVNFIRPQLVTISGAVLPNAYGGKQRSIMIYLDPKALQAKGLSPSDVLNAMAQQNVVEPGGTAKIGSAEYDVRLNSSPSTIQGLSDIPIKQINGAMVYVRDVATVADGFIPQTNIVRQDGHRGVLLSVLKSGSASTLSVVKGVLGLLPRVEASLPPSLKITPIGNQALFVRASISGVVREAIIAATLTGLMILLFLGSWRSTVIIAVSIPLSILTSIIILGLIGQTINIMTLGGLALAVGILVDDATVAIENIERNIAMGKEMKQAILDGSQQIALPAFVSTLCICIVFVPMFFLTGVAKFLFVPLAEAVVFAMLASYLLSRTLVPTMVLYIMRGHEHKAAEPKTILGRFQRGFERGFERFRTNYRDMLGSALEHRKVFAAAFLAFCVISFGLIFFLGEDFFPSVDAGVFRLHVRGRAGTRIEETARLCDEVENVLRKEIPKDELVTILDNIGLPFSSINTTYSTSGTIGTSDAEILVSLNEKHHRPTDEYVKKLREDLPLYFPGVEFFFQPADIVSQILNFGLPSPI